METKSTKAYMKGPEVVVSRLFNAPRELVFDAYSKIEHLDKWWGPNGFTNDTKSFEFKLGGVWLFDMHGFGQVFPNKIVFTEIVKNEKIALVHSDDKDQNPFNAVITFEKQGDKTLLTVRTIFSSQEYLEKVVKEFGALEGADQGMDKLEQYISTLN